MEIEDRQHIEVDPYGTMVNKEGKLYSSKVLGRDYMAEWEEPRPWLQWLNALLASAYVGYQFYRRWRAAKRAPMYPIGLIDRGN